VGVDGVVKLVTIKQHGIDFKDALIWRFGEPNQVIKTGAEELWSYGSQWSAVVSGSRVREVWIAQ